MLPSILLVEDNAHDVELTLAAFNRCNLANRVEVVYSGEAAMDYLLKRGLYADRLGGNPALVLLDLRLPQMDGIEVLKLIRSTPSLAFIPVTVLSGSDDEADRSRTCSLGINVYLNKPVHFAEFVEAVAQAGAVNALV